MFQIGNKGLKKGDILMRSFTLNYTSNLTCVVFVCEEPTDVWGLRF